MAKNILNKIVKNEVKEAVEDIEWQTTMPANVDNEFADLVDAIHKGYVANNEPKFTKKKTFSPSTIVFGHGKCPRYWYLAFEGNTFYEEREGKSQANMESGTDRHARIQAAMEGAGIMVANEEKVIFDDPPIFGFLDSIIKWKDSE